MATYSPDNLEMIARACEALSEPHRHCYWHAPERIPITDPNGEPLGALIWDRQRQTYRFKVGA